METNKRAIDFTVARVNEITSVAPKGFTDMRKSLEDKNLDALVIAAPDHWHAPAALMAVKAGKQCICRKTL